MEDFEDSSIQQETSSVQSSETSTSTAVSSKRKKKKVKKFCRLCKWGCLHVDYKNVSMLQKYLKNNKIITHKITGNCLKHQHQVAIAIKRARIVALLPFVED